MKKSAIFLLFLVTISLLNLNLLGRWFIDEPLQRGEIETGYVIVRNDGDTKLEDVNVKFYILDLGLRYNSMASDVAKNDHVVQRLFMSIPQNVPPGDYLTKIVVGNDKVRDSKFIYLRII